MLLVLVGELVLSELSSQGADGERRAVRVSAIDGAVTVVIDGVGALLARAESDAIGIAGVGQAVAIVVPVVVAGSLR